MQRIATAEDRAGAFVTVRVARPARRRPDPAVRPCRQRLPAGYGTLGLPPAQLKRHIAYDIGAAAVTRHRGAALGVPGGADALFAPADRSQSRRRRSDADHAALGRRRRPRQSPSRRGRARPARRPLLRALSRAVDAVLDRCVADRRAAGAALDPQLHRELEGRAAALARRHAVGRDAASGAAAARRVSTPRAVSSSATTSPTTAGSRATACGSTHARAASPTR